MFQNHGMNEYYFGSKKQLKPISNIWLCQVAYTQTCHLKNTNKIDNKLLIGYNSSSPA